MFRTWKSDVKKSLKKGKNSLEVRFYCAPKKGKELASKLPYQLPENERVFVRKAQYHFGWDWGPRFVTAGIWKPVILELWNNAKIENVSFKQTLTIRLINDKTLEISTNILAKDVYLKNRNDNLEDNFFDLLPGEKKMITSDKPIEIESVKTLYDVLK